MSDAIDILALVKARLAERSREEVDRLSVIHDWYAPDCPCGLPPGDCVEHPRARAAQRPPGDPLASARPMHRLHPDILKMLLGPEDGEDFLRGVEEAKRSGPIEDDLWVWLIAAGRGFGKTRTGAQWCHHVVRELKGGGVFANLALINNTIGDVRTVQIEGPSGLIATCPPWMHCEFHPSKSRVSWYDARSGNEIGRGLIASAQEFERLRGPQFHGSWADELAKWQYTQSECWEQIQLSTRLTPNFGILVTTTPQPTDTYKEILFDPHTWVSTGSTYENTRHLDPTFFARVRSRYEGTTLGKQELYAQLLGDVEGSMWSRALIESARWSGAIDDLNRPIGIPIRSIVVAVDPNASSNNDEAGILVVGKEDGTDAPRAVVLGDETTSGGPYVWGRAAVQALVRWGASKIVVERNNGGEMCELVIRQACQELHREEPRRYPPSVPIETVWASRGKMIRAEPVKSRYEQGRVVHATRFSELEDEMRTWRPQDRKSPNRLDALVWGVTALIVGAKAPPIAPASGAYAHVHVPKLTAPIRPFGRTSGRTRPRSFRR